jgi:hypothetical protein
VVVAFRARIRKSKTLALACARLRKGAALVNFLSAMLRAGRVFT